MSQSNYDGTWNDGCGIGASTNEQRAAGVTSGDSHAIAAGKVLIDRDRRIADGTYVAPPPTDWSWMWWCLYFAANLVVFFGTTDELHKFRQNHTQSAFESYNPIAPIEVNSPSRRLDYIAFYRKNEEAKMAVLFKPNTYIAQIWTKCQDRLCVKAGWNALNSMRAFALHPEHFEHEICTKLLLGDQQLDGEPEFRIQPQTGQCEISNLRDVNSRIYWHNMPYTVMFWIMTVVLLGLLIVINIYGWKLHNKRQAAAV